MRTRELGRDQVDVELFAWVDQEEANFRNVESRAKRAVLDALMSGGIALPEDALIIHASARAEGVHEEPAHDAGEPAHEDGEPAQEDGDAAAEHAEQAEAIDQAFLAAQLALARSAKGERDLLEEGAERGAERVVTPRSHAVAPRSRAVTPRSRA